MCNAIFGISVDIVEQPNPLCGSNDKVKKALHHIKALQQGGVVFEPLANFLCCVLRLFVRNAQQAENHQCEVSFKFFLSLLQSHLCGSDVLPVERLHGLNDSVGELLFYFHCSVVFAIESVVLASVVVIFRAKPQG